MERERLRSSMHQRVARALERAARVQEESLALIEECRRVSLALHDTMQSTHRRRGAGSRPHPRP